MPERLYFTDAEECNRLIATDPMALLIGFVLDQQVSVQKAFSGPLALQERLGSLTPEELAAADLEPTFRQRPAIHRFPGAMARRVHDLAVHIRDHYDGDAARVWSYAGNGEQLRANLAALPGFGEMKIKALGAVLAKRFDVEVARELVPGPSDPRRRGLTAGAGGLPGGQACAQGRVVEGARRRVERPRRAVSTVELATPHGPGRAHLEPVQGARAALVLGHGAGGGVSAPDLVTAAAAASSCGLTVALVEQPYRVAGRRSPAPARQLDAAWEAMIEGLRGDSLAGLALIGGGRSSGARVACRTADATGVGGVLCLAFPLQPPGRRRDGTRSPNRLDELDAVTVPTLVVQGSDRSVRRSTADRHPNGHHHSWRSRLEERPRRTRRCRARVASDGSVDAVEESGRRESNPP